MLFDLDTDPDEIEDIAAKEPETVERLRNLLIQHFEEENRGERYVKNGKLVKRYRINLYSPNMPENNPALYYPDRKSVV